MNAIQLKAGARAVPNQYPIAQITPTGQESVTMTSLELVDFINEDRKARAEAAGAAFPSPGFAKLEHKDFLEKVPVVLGVETSAEFSADLPDSYGRPRRGYRFPKREACLMAMSYSYELQAKVFDRMTELEAGAAPKLPQTMAQALRLAAEQAEMLEQQQAQLALAAPKVEFVNRYVEASGLQTFRQVAKLLRANEARFREFLVDSGVMYYLAGRMTPHQNHIDAGRFEMRTGVSRHNEHAYTATKFTAKGVEWIAGLWNQHKAKVQAAEEV